MRKYYFVITSSVLLLLALIAFSDNLFYDVKQESNSDPKFIIHGLFFLAWYVFLVIQSFQIKNRNIKAHIRQGTFGMVVAAGVVLSTFYVFFAIYKGWDAMPFFVKANRMHTTVFAIYVFLAFRYRKKPASHKRFIYLGTLFVLGPVLDRVIGLGGVPDLATAAIMEAVIWTILFIAQFRYDWVTIKKIHSISWVSFLLFYGIWGLSLYL